MHSRHNARLAELERRAVVAPSEPTEAATAWTAEDWQRRAFWALVHNEMVIDHPGHVRVQTWPTKPLHYDFLQEMADVINDGWAEQPGAVLVPLMPDQVTTGLRALDAGLIDQHFRGMPRASELDGKCYAFGEPFDLHGLAYDLSNALKIVNAQAPEPFGNSLDGLGHMLTWHKQEIGL